MSSLPNRNAIWLYIEIISRFLALSIQKVVFWHFRNAFLLVVLHLAEWHY
jgi:hypothetical protein